MPGAGLQETVKPGILSEAGRHPAKLRPVGWLTADFNFGHFFRLTVEGAGGAPPAGHDLPRPRGAGRSSDMDMTCELQNTLDDIIQR
jgi:hypothetical protein